MANYLFACCNLILLAFNELREFIGIHIIYSGGNDIIRKPVYFLLLSQVNIINKKILCNHRVWGYIKDFFPKSCSNSKVLREKTPLLQISYFPKAR